MPAKNTKDLNIRGINHPKYNSTRILEDRPIELIIQKLENILFSNKGDVFGDPDFGCDLQFYLWRTDAPKESIQRNIHEQINKYIPEINQYNYSVNLDLYQGTVKDIMYVNIKIEETSVTVIYK